MENNETITTLKGIETKQGKTGNSYFLIATDFGNLSSFDKELVDELRKFIGKKIKINYKTTDKGFMNLKSFISEDYVVKEEKIETEKESEDDKKAARKLKDVAVFTSYAKDIFIAFLQMPNRTEADASALMNSAITCVKQAREAFNQ